MQEPIETEEFRGYTVKVYHDEDPMDPRKDWEPLGKMICFHRRYNLGDKHNYSFSDYRDFEDFEKHLIAECGAVVILPLYLYDHSGITMKTGPFSCRWDSGQVGFIYATRKDILKFYSGAGPSNKPKKLLTKNLIARAAGVLECEVMAYDAFISGQYTGFVIEKDGKEQESCWGFGPYKNTDGKEVCSIKHALEEARSVVNDLICSANSPLIPSIL